MSCDLESGQCIELTKEGETLDRIVVNIGWHAAEPGPEKNILLSELLGGGGLKTEDIDCDSVAILCDADGKIIESTDMVFFNNLNHPSGAVWHMGDCLYDADRGDDEQIMIELSKIPEVYQKIVFVVTIYQARARHQHFGGINSAFIKLSNGQDEAGEELCQFHLTEDCSNVTAMTLGELVRQDQCWIFKTIGQGTTDDGVAELARRYQ